MPKIITTLELRRRLGTHVKGIEGYTVVANETFKNRTFLMVEPQVMIGLALKAGANSLASDIAKALEDVSAKVSAKYKGIVTQRGKFKLYD